MFKNAVSLVKLLNRHTAGEGGEEEGMQAPTLLAAVAGKEFSSSFPHSCAEDRTGWPTFVSRYSAL